MAARTSALLSWLCGSMGPLPPPEASEEAAEELKLVMALLSISMVREGGAAAGARLPPNPPMSAGLLRGWCGEEGGRRSRSRAGGRGLLVVGMVGGPGCCRKVATLSSC